MRRFALAVAAVVLAQTAAAQPASQLFRKAETFSNSGDYVATIALADVGRPGGGAPDGELDVITLDVGGMVATLFGTSDARLFVPGSPTTLPTQPAAFAIEKFNADSVPDMLVGGEDGTVTFLPGSGANPPFGTAGTAIHVGDRAVAIVPARVNEDDSLDAIVVDEGAFGDGAIVALLGDGHGSFRLGNPISAGNGTAGAAVGQFNGDNHLDVAVVNAGGNTISVFRGDGTGGFTLVQTRSTGREPVGIAAARLNADGFLDLVVVNRADDTVSIFDGVGDGTFAAGRTFPSGGAGSSPGGVAIADVNHDAALDVLTVNKRSSDVSVLLGNGAGRLAAPRAFVVGEDALAVATGDIDADGADDIAAVTQGLPGVAVLLGIGDGSFAGVENVLTLPNPAGVVTGDVDNDGLADLIVAGAAEGGGLEVLLASRAGGFQAPMTLPGVVDATAVGRGDFNGDGRLDIAVASRQGGTVSVFLNDRRAGGFGPAQPYAVDDRPVAISTGDWNGDGRVDLAVACQGAGADGTVAILLANPNGTFGTATLLPLGKSPTAMDLGDFNADGKLDLVAVNNGSNTVSVLLGAGDGTFGVVAPPSSLETPFAVAVGDFDLDGKDDLAVGNHGNSVTMLYGNGQGGFTRGQVLSLGGGTLSALAARDFDFTGDLIPDVLVADESTDNQAIVFLGNGNRSTRFLSQDYPLSRQPMASTAGDTNGDGRYDGILATSFVGSVAVLTNIRATPVRRGDGNNDGRVTAADVVAVFRELPENPAGRVEVIDRGSYKPGAGIDANGDGLVTAQDTSGTIAWAFRPF